MNIKGMRKTVFFLFLLVNIAVLGAAGLGIGALVSAPLTGLFVGLGVGLLIAMALTAFVLLVRKAAYIAADQKYKQYQSPFK